MLNLVLDSSVPCYASVHGYVNMLMILYVHIPLSYIQFYEVGFWTSLVMTAFCSVLQLFAYLWF